MVLSFFPYHLIALTGFVSSSEMLNQLVVSEEYNDLLSNFQGFYVRVRFELVKDYMFLWAKTFFCGIKLVMPIYIAAVLKLLLVTK
jgi:hypothetical protein